MSLVKKIVQGRGGNVRVESQPGQGATFRFLIILLDLKLPKMERGYRVWV